MVCCDWLFSEAAIQEVEPEHDGIQEDSAMQGKHALFIALYLLNV